MVVGNINEKSLVSIWEEMRVSPLLNQIKDPKTRSGPCLDCPYLEECKGCRSRSFALTGSWFSSDSVCPLLSQKSLFKEAK
jgi:radical SAM protein with 4Fe4S-binding SPASM domain